MKSNQYYLRAYWVWFLVVGLAACGSSPEGDGDAGPVGNVDGGIASDGGSPDAELDAGLDASPPDASSVDGGPPDAGPADSDGDGIPDDEDCAPDDETVGASSSRPCSTACGDGTEECAGGTWDDCSASTECLCDTPSVRRVVTCGMCGEQSEECTDGTWQPVSSCLAEGPCAPGSVELREPGWCRVDERLCRVDCTWGNWTTTDPGGVCTPGSHYCDPSTDIDRLCDVDCQYIDDPDCPVNP